MASSPDQSNELSVLDGSIVPDSPQDILMKWLYIQSTLIINTWITYSCTLQKHSAILNRAG